MSSFTPCSTAARLRSVVAFTLAGGLLAACSETGEFSLKEALQPKESAEEVVARAAADAEVVERDVEAPEVFLATEAGLWDGRPSLGGIWVAHPDVDEPERVMIRNKTNDKFVVGALFRRERDNPGPRLMVSSDAADTLGILAGAPTELEVVALRKEEVVLEPVIAEPVEADLIETPDAIETASLGPIDVAETAIAEDDSAVEAPQSSVISAPEAPAAPAPQTQATEVAALAAAAIASTDTATDAAPAGVETPTAAKPVGSRMRKPYLQVGIFSVEENATRTADILRSSGIVPTVRSLEKDNKTSWRVLVGPARNKMEQLQLKQAIRKQGFADAYAVSN